MITRLTHYAFDAVLISAFLAGIKRSTGLTVLLALDAAYLFPHLSPFFLQLMPPPALPFFASDELTCLTPRGLPRNLHRPSLNSDRITENREIKKWIDKYLGVGEWVMDQSVAVLGSSGWFERRR
ncbi:Fungal protein of unknown function (DUF1748) domain containing protein [Elaphomyces granulatus]